MLAMPSQGVPGLKSWLLGWNLLYRTRKIDERTVTQITQMTIRMISWSNVWMNGMTGWMKWGNWLKKTRNSSKW